MFAFGLYTPDDERLTATMQAVKEKLWVEAEFKGVARYQDDGYYRTDRKITGNPWIICTLWLADYLIQKDGADDDLQEAIKIISLAAQRALPSGVLPEQVQPAHRRTSIGGAAYLEPRHVSHYHAGIDAPAGPTTDLSNLRGHALQPPAPQRLDRSTVCLHLQFDSWDLQTLNGLLEIDGLGLFIHIITYKKNIF